MTASNTTSVIAGSGEITAPVRLEGQSNSEVIFNWMKLHGFLWMLIPPYDQQLEQILGSRARLRLGYKLIKWKRQQDHGDGHEALVAPQDRESRQAAFTRLQKMLEVHLFGL